MKPIFNRLFNINISLKIFLGYFLLVGLAAWFVLTVFMDEVKPGVRQAMEDSLVDTANVLAELAAQDVMAGKIQEGVFAQGLAHYQMRSNKANIWGISKQDADYRVYVTDDHGIVIFDSAHLALGQDYSQWRDVYLTLRGKYGARSSPAVAGDKEGDTIMYIAAPIKDNKRIIGVLTVAKPNRTLLPFIERAQKKIILWGLLLTLLSISLGALFTWRFTRTIHRLRDYAIAVSQGQKAIRPESSNDELEELAHAMQIMRNELDGKQYIQDSIQHLTHELKSPISAIQGALELISPTMPPQDQAHFLAQIKAQSTRVQTIIQNMLGLAALEHQQHIQHRTRVCLADLVHTQIAHLAEKAALRQVRINVHIDPKIHLYGEAFLLGQAIYNLLENALDFSPKQGEIEVTAELLSDTENTLAETTVRLSVADQGAGVPHYALNKVFDKFYSLPRPHTQQKSTGLGLNFVQEVAKLHGGQIQLKNQQKADKVCGAVAVLVLPVA